MDPIVAFGVAGTSARLATTAWNTGEALSAFIKNAKTVDLLIEDEGFESKPLKPHTNFRVTNP
jgi:hypothetical protein